MLIKEIIALDKSSRPNAALSNNERCATA